MMKKLAAGVVLALTVALANFAIAGGPVERTIPIKKTTALYRPKTYTFHFSIHDAAVDGNELWSEEKSVRLTTKTLSHNLGSVVAFADAAAGPLDFSEQYWMQVAYWTGKAWKMLGTTRDKLVVAPYALWSLNPGPAGEVGPDGPQGPQGELGPKGDSGAQGGTGPAGPQGDTGSTGSTGPQGADGVSVTSTTLSAGDPNCQYGGTQFTSSTGTTFACNGSSAARATYRWNVFSTYDNNGTWFMGNSGALTGGVPPQVWTDGGGIASYLSSDKEVLRALFTQKGYGGTNALVYSDTSVQYSSTNGKMVVALFRVKNTSASDITWVPNFWFTAYSGWGEMASVALNGANILMNGGGAGTLNINIGLGIPANRTSTVVFVSGSSAPLNTGFPFFSRSTFMGFSNNSLALPAGLQFVDDLDTATGGWEQ